MLVVEARRGEHPEGIVVSWTPHILLLLDERWWASYFTALQMMNAALGIVLKAFGYDAEPFGPGGAWIVAAEPPSTGGAHSIPTEGGM